jgi:hypothetical protein
MQTTFHNTISLSGDALKKAVMDAEKQEDAIYLIFLHTGKKYTASDISRITEKAGRKWPLHSNRRAITNLKTSGRLIKLQEMKEGLYGKPESFYMINQKTA